MSDVQRLIPKFSFERSTSREKMKNPSFFASRPSCLASASSSRVLHAFISISAWSSEHWM